MSTLLKALFLTITIVIASGCGVKLPGVIIGTTGYAKTILEAEYGQPMDYHSPQDKEELQKKIQTYRSY